MRPLSSRPVGSRAFISVGGRVSTGDLVFCVLVERVIRNVLRLKFLVKRKEALRGRSVSTPFGHPKHASENPPCDSDRTLEPDVCVTSSLFRHHHVVALDSRGGIGVPVLRRRSGATRNMKSPMNSPLVTSSWNDLDANFASRHPGGVHFLFGDGAVHFLAETINWSTYQNLANRADGNPVTIP